MDKAFGSSKLSNSDFSRFLSDTLSTKIQRNPRFSVRAFARALRLEPSYLSKILRRERSATSTLIDRVAPYLALSSDDCFQFKQEIRRKKKERREQRKKAATAEFQPLSHDTFLMISRWYHYAFLEMLLIDSTPRTPKAVAKALGVSEEEAIAAIDRLKRIGALKEKEDGTWQQPKNFTTLSGPFTHDAFQQLQRELLSRAADAMERYPLEIRDQSSMTIAIDSRLLPAAKKRIAKFRRSLAAYLQGTGKQDSVYQLVLSLYPGSDEWAEVAWKRRRGQK